jgi:hypothetical protein
MTPDLDLDRNGNRNRNLNPDPNPDHLALGHVLRQAYYIDHGDVMVTDLGEIRAHYFKTWFAIDLVSSIPLDLTLGLINGGSWHQEQAKPS